MKLSFITSAYFSCFSSSLCVIVALTLQNYKRKVGYLDFVQPGRIGKWSHNFTRNWTDSKYQHLFFYSLYKK